MSDPGLNVEIGANVDPALAGFQKLADAVGGLSTQFTGSFGAMAGAINAIKAPLVALGTIILGGGALKHIISETVSWTLQAKKLSTVLGTSTQEASAWAMAVEAGGASIDSLNGALGMMTMRIANGGEAYERYGITIEGANGGMRSMADIFEDVSRKAAGMSNAGERNAMLAKLIGRGWREVIPVMAAVRANLDEARHMAERYGLAVTEDGYQATKDFQRAVHEAKEPIEGLTVAIGQRLMPALTAMGSSMAEMGGAAFPNLMAFVEGFIIVIDALTTALKILFTGFLMGISIIYRFGEALGVVAYALERLAGGDINLSEMTDEISTGLTEVWDNLAADAVAHRDDIADSFEGMATRSAAAVKRAIGDTSEEGQSGPKHDLGGEGGGDMPDMSGAWMKKVQEAYDGMKASVYAPTLQQELQFWSAYEDQAIAGGSKLEEASKQLHAKRLEIQARMGIDLNEAAKAEARDSIAVGRHSASEKLDVAREEERLTVALYKEGSAQARAAHSATLAAENAALEESRSLLEKDVDAREGTALRKIEAEQAFIQFQREQGILSVAESIAALQDSEQRKLDILLGSIDEKATIYADDLVKQREYENQIQQIQEEGAAKQAQIQRDLFQQTKATVGTFLAPIESAFTGMFDSLIEGTADMAKIVSGLWKGLAKAVIGELIRIAMQRIALAITESIVGKASALGLANANIAVAATGAAASVAAVPLVGLGAGMAAATTMTTFLEGITASLLGSAAGGWDLGRENPIAQLHAREMVLPAHLAERVRGMTEPGGGGGGGTTQVTVNVHGAIDGQSVYRVLTENSQQVLKAMTEFQRNGRF